MNHLPLPSNTFDSQQLVARLQQHPELQAAIDRLLTSVENAAGDATTADAVEDLVVAQVRVIGQQAPRLGRNARRHAWSKAMRHGLVFSGGVKKTLVADPLWESDGVGTTLAQRGKSAYPPAFCGECESALSGLQFRLGACGDGLGG